MNKYKRQHDFNDELLSAYLDDELSPDERARVEARLAEDPDARALVEQLRAVSQSIQDLPAESVATDLREAILARAEKTMLTGASPFPRIAQKPEDADSPDTGIQVGDASLPPFSIGRTRRGWVWAGLAVAAALLVAFIQPDEEPVENVAQRRQQAPPLGEIEMRSLDSADLPPIAESESDSTAPPSPSPSMIARAPSSTEGLEPDAPNDQPLFRSSSDLNRQESSSPAPVSRSRNSGVGEGDSLDEGATQAPDAETASPETIAESSAESMAPGTAGDDSGAAAGALASQQQLVVVHVNATRAAFETKSFDQVLINNGIALEDSTNDNNLESTDRAQVGIAVADGRPVRAESPAINPVVDWVLVEAPASTIEACLNDLNADSTNFLAVEVEASTESPDSQSTNLTHEFNWGQFSRGAVPQQQKRLAYATNDYFVDASEAKPVAGPAPPSARGAIEEPASPAGRLETMAQARRIEPPNEAHTRSKPDPPVRAMESDDLRAPSGRQMAEADRDTIGATNDVTMPIQVLFVIGTDLTPPAAAGTTTPSPASAPQ